MAHLDSRLRHELLDRLPDVPRNVETRSALLRGECTLFGTASGCVVRVDPDRLLSVVGSPSEADMVAALAGLEGAWTCICPLEQGARWAAVLPGWSLEPATLHLLPEEVERIDAPRVAARVDELSEATTELVRHLPVGLRREIVSAAGRYPIVAAWVRGLPVAFCYAAATETLWDLAVETLPDHRRRGFAQACFARLFDVMTRAGKRPVWGAVDSNVASLRLAQKLGFRETDRIALLEGSANG